MQYETYDEKALEETTFYGLPMARLPQQASLSSLTTSSLTTSSVTTSSVTTSSVTTSSVTTASVTPTPLPFSTDPVTGLDIVPFNLNPNFHDNDLGALGHYDDIDGQNGRLGGRGRSCR